MDMYVTQIDKMGTTAPGSGAIILVTASPKSTDPLTQLTIERDESDLKEPREDDVITIRNQGQGDLRVNSVTISGQYGELFKIRNRDGTAYNGNPFTISPDNLENLFVGFSFQGREPGKYNAELIINSDASNTSTLRIPVLGRFTRGGTNRGTTGRAP